MNFGVVRSVAQAPPSKEVWEYMCQLLDSANGPGELERVLGYLESSIRNWPVELRRMSKSWKKQVVAGKRVERARIARTLWFGSTGGGQLRAMVIRGLPGAEHIERLEIEGEHLDMDGLASLLESEWLSALNTLSIRSMRFATQSAKSWSRLADAIAARPKLTRLEFDNALSLRRGLFATLSSRDRGIQSLSVTRCGAQLEVIQQIAKMVETSRIERLNLRGNRCGDAGWAALAARDLSSLRELELNGTMGTPSAAEKLSQGALGGVEVLRIGHNKLRENGLEALLGATGALKVLDVDLVGDAEGLPRVLGATRALEGLVEARLGFAFGAQERVCEALVASGALENMERLRVENLDAAGARVLLGASMSRLTELEVSRSNLGVSTWDALLGNESLGGLERFRLDDCAHVKGEGWTRFCDGEGVEGVVRLEIEDCDGDDERGVLGDLAGSERVGRLGRLTLRRVEVSREGIERLYGDERVTRLDSIDLELNRSPTQGEATALLTPEHKPKYWRPLKAALKVRRGT